MLAKETGWSKHYIMWKISWINIQMMLADAPGMKRKKHKEEEVVKTPMSGQAFAALRAKKR